MSDHFVWLTMSYTLPINPTAKRVYVWRKLREMGAESLRQGVAVLPVSKENLLRLRELAGHIREMEGGRAVVAELRFLEEADNRQMVELFRHQSLSEYRELLLDMANLCNKLGKAPGGSSGKAIQKRYKSAKERDFFDAEEQLPGPTTVGRLLAGLDSGLDGGWSQMVQDIQESYKEVGRFLSGQGENL